MATDTLKLSLEPRSITGKQVKSLRKQGIIPVAVCGKGIEPYNAQVNEREFTALIKKAGYTTLIEVSMPGKKRQQAFLQEYQRHPLSLRIMHADLKVVDVNEPVIVEVPVVVSVENSMVERGQAVLNNPLHTLSLKALPTNLPHQIDIDLSVLTEFDQAIHVRDLQFGDGVEVLSDLDAVVFNLAHPRVEVATEEPTEAPETEE